MKYNIIQIVDHQTGERTQPLRITPRELADAIKKFLHEKEEGEIREQAMDDFILVLGQEDGKELQIMDTPLHTVRSFLSAFHPELIDHPNKLNGNPLEH